MSASNSFKDWPAIWDLWRYLGNHIPPLSRNFIPAWLRDQEPHSHSHFIQTVKSRDLESHSHSRFLTSKHNLIVCYSRKGIRVCWVRVRVKQEYTLRTSETQGWLNCREKSWTFSVIIVEVSILALSLSLSLCKSPWISWIWWWYGSRVRGNVRSIDTIRNLHFFSLGKIQLPPLRFGPNTGPPLTSGKLR